MKKVIQCTCGSVIEGQDDDGVVKKAQAHAKTTHGMDLSREQALSMAKPALTMSVHCLDVPAHTRSMKHLF
jgi:predicted small metal-binding protein